MNKNILNEQIIDAKENTNFFFARIIFVLIWTIIKLAIIVGIGILINNPILVGIELLYTIYLLHNVIGKVNYYFSIIRDINDTLKFTDDSVCVDFGEVRKLVLSSVVK